MKVIRKRNFMQSFNCPQGRILNYNFNNLSKKVKYPNEKNDYINPIIHNNNILTNETKIPISLINNNNYHIPFNSNNENEKTNKIELYNKMNHFLISNALKSEITFSHLFKEYIPKKIDFLEDKTRMHIDLE